MERVTYGKTFPASNTSLAMSHFGPRGRERSCLGRTGAATRCAQIQPGRRSDSTDREQHAGDTRNQDLCRQSVQGRCRHRHNRGAEIAAADRGADAEQQSRSQRSGNDFGAVHSGTQRHPHRCSSAHDGAGLSDRPDAFGTTGEGGVLINVPNKGPNSVVTVKDIEESGVELGPNRIPVIHTGFTEKTWGKPEFWT